MPDNVPTRSHGKGTLHSATLDIKSMEKRILSSSQHLNEIISLNAIVQVSCSFHAKLTFRRRNPTYLSKPQLR
jgi:hypothetical protein